MQGLPAVITPATQHAAHKRREKASDYRLATAAGWKAHAATCAHCQKFAAMTAAERAAAVQ